MTDEMRALLNGLVHYGENGKVAEPWMVKRLREMLEPQEHEKEVRFREPVYDRNPQIGKPYAWRQKDSGEWEPVLFAITGKSAPETTMCDCNQGRLPCTCKPSHDG